MLAHSARRLARFAAAVSLATVSVLASAPPVLAQQGMTHVRGEIKAVDGDMLTVMSRDGQALTIALPPKIRVSGLAETALDAIKTGSYIGTAAMPQKDGSLIAQEVLVFPEAMRGVGEGHRPWDLTDGSTMTNATVDAVVGAVKGHSLTIKYKGGEKMLLVPSGTPVVTIVRASKSELTPGASIFAVAKKRPDGTYEAARISVGKNGLVPPM